MLPSKVMPYLLRLAAPSTDSSMVQIKTYKGKVFSIGCKDLIEHFLEVVCSSVWLLIAKAHLLSVRNIHSI